MFRIVNKIIRRVCVFISVGVHIFKGNPILFTSLGDIIDRATILNIKFEKTKERRYKEQEQQLLKMGQAICTNKSAEEYFLRTFGELYDVNKLLWDSEDSIREAVSQEQIATEASLIIRLNDKRSLIKAQIDDLFTQNYKDEKAYNG